MTNSTPSKICRFPIFKSFRGLTALVLTMITCAQVLAQTAIKSNLPIIVINANGATIPDADKIPATFKIVQPDGGGIYSFDAASASNVFQYQSDIGIEIRGNSSIHWPKKSFGVELRVSPTGDNKDESLLGMSPEADWVLNAVYGDKSLMRDVVAHEMYRKTGRYSPNSRYVEVFLQESGSMQYNGIYVLIEKIKKADGRVNVKKLAETDSDVAKITGGYIVQIGEDEELKWSSTYPPVDAPSQPSPIFHVEYPKLHKYGAAYTANRDAQLNYIKGFVNNFETVLSGSGFADPVTGYRKYIDVDAMVDYLLHEEFTKNVDNWRISAFFYKNRDSEGGLMIMGPPWDFDRAMGNQQWCFEPSVLPDGTWSWQYNLNCPGRPAMTVLWPKRLLSDCYFKDKLTARFIALRQNEWSNTSISNFIASQKAVLTTNITQTAGGVQQSPVARNFARWPILPDPIMNNDHYDRTNNTYDREVDYLNTWLAAHLTWMRNNITSISSSSCTPLPVTFASVDVKMKEKAAVVSWSTATEDNNERFEVERSSDGLKFEVVGAVEGKKQSTELSHYSLLDETPLPGISYYRIRQFDLDGTSSISMMKSIENRLLQMGRIFPNPGDDFVTLDQPLNDAEIRVVNASGKVVRTIPAAGKVERISLHGLPAGVYIVEVLQARTGYRSSHKLVVGK